MGACLVGDTQTPVSSPSWAPPKRDSVRGFRNLRGAKLCRILILGRDSKGTATMSKKGSAAADVIVKLIVGAGQASPSPPVGPALGSKGVKSMDFCKVRGRNEAYWETTMVSSDVLDLR